MSVLLLRFMPDYARVGVVRRVTALRPDVWILAALAFALLIRLIGLGVAPLWHDEVETAIWAGLSPEQAARTVIWRIPFGRYDPYQLPFYFVTVNAWTAIAGHSPWLLRLPSVLFATLAVALIAAVAQTLVNTTAARWAAGLAAVSPYLLNHAQEARMYSLICMLAAGSMLLLVRFLSGKSTTLGIGFVALNAALLATHYYTLFFVGAEVLVLLIFHPRPWRSWVFGAVGSCVATALLAYIGLFLSPHRSGSIYPIGLFAVPGVVWSMLSGYTLLPSSEELHAGGLQAVRPYLPYALVSVIPFALLLIAGLRSLSMKALAVILIILAAVFTGPFLAYVLFPAISINPRYFMAGAPALLVLLAAGMPQSPREYARAVSALVVVSIMAIGSTRHLADPGQKREDGIAAGRWLDSHVAANEEILVTSDEMATLAYYYWPGRRFRLYPEGRVVANSRNAAAVADGIPFSNSGRAVYMFGRSWISDPDAALQKAIERRYTLCEGTDVRGIRVYCIVKP